MTEILDPHRRQSSLLLSPTLASTFLGCRLAALWTIEASAGLRAYPAAVADPGSERLKAKGFEHEAACVSHLSKTFGPVTIIPDTGPVEARRAWTLAAMAAGAPVIVQAAISGGRWAGYADFLVRIDEPSPRWAWSYEPWDAKLARTAKPTHVMQIALYGEMLRTIQGVASREAALLLGTGDPDAPQRVERYRLDEVRHYVRRVADRIEAFVDSPPDDLVAEPCSACAQCRWMTVCETEWERVDHLHRVAGISSRQIERLAAAGITTRAGLAVTAPTHVAGIGPDTLNRLVQQARLSHESEATGTGRYEVLSCAGAGLSRLPPTDPFDLFFDFEGDPLHPGGLEYLCGVLWRIMPSDVQEPHAEPVPGHPDLRFRAFWAHDRDAERKALRDLVAFLTERLSRSPAARLYHYAPYEKTALRRLASMHASCEVEVDDLLRQERMIDLYQVVRGGVRIGERSYSIKALERFYMAARETTVASGSDSLAVYDAWRQTNDPAPLDDLRDYNRDDCLSTLLLRDWLLDLARAAGIEPAEKIVTENEQPEPVYKSEFMSELEVEQAGLENALTGKSDAPDADAARLMADLLGFHRREAKPEWWAFFDRQTCSPEELIDDDDCLGACEADGETWTGYVKRSVTFRYRYPEQETKFGLGDVVHLATTGESAGTICDLEEKARLVTIKRGKSRPPLAPAASFIPGKPIGTDVLREAVWEAARDWLSGSPAMPHIRALLTRSLPAIAGLAIGTPVVREADRTDPDRTLAAATRAVLNLDRSCLAIQGPPGAGKTFTTARLVMAAIRAGKTVGISSNSHNAIDNLLAAIKQHAVETGWTGRLGQKRDDGGYDGVLIETASANEDVDPSAPLLAGTAWLFARPELRGSRDLLFVDEAGQVSLGHLVAMAGAARALVLVGDQQQLGQPLRGSHPGESGTSCLDHLLQGNAVIPPERGVFLANTWRMHPDLTGFVSDVFYDGALRSVPHCANQELVLRPDHDPALRSTGLSFVPVSHTGCRQKSEVEAALVQRLVVDLLRHEVRDHTGQLRRLALADILVVAPYNQQVNHLVSILPDGTRVGTVDMVQGQEANVVIVSMTTSGAADMPRDPNFLLSRHRLNVALSRGRCLAVLIASEDLLNLHVGSVEEMRLVNTLVLASDVSGIQSRGGREAALASVLADNLKRSPSTEVSGR